MANTYSQIYIQVVFAVEGRQSLIRKENKEELHKYLTGIVTEREQKPLAVHCMPDHTHILIGLRPSMALSDLVHDVKIGSTNFVNRKAWVAGRFGWQEGFGAFSFGHSQLTRIIRYIQDQEQHHAKITFREEYLRFLKRYEIDHDERYIFKRPSENQTRCAAIFGMVVLRFSNPVTGCLFIERREPEIFPFVFQRRAVGRWLDNCSSRNRAPLKNKRGEGGWALQAINRQPRWGFEKSHSS